MNLTLKFFLIVFAVLFCAFQTQAQEPIKSREEAEAVAAALNYQGGEVVLANGLATLRVPEGMRYLNGTDANTVLVRLWGNPPAAKPLGLLMPEGNPLRDESWAVIITFDEDGYVKDEEAGKIDYNKLLKEMQEGTRESSQERVKQGYESVELIGWAATPRYDQAAKKLYWAKELKFGAYPEHTLNYDIRMLGRRGVLNLRAVAGIGQLREIEEKTPAILAAIDFNPGHRYADFSAAAGDKVAQYGLGALIAGGVAAKLGFFKGLWVAILAGKKFVIIGVVALAAALRKFLRRKSPAESGAAP